MATILGEKYQRMTETDRRTWLAAAFAILPKLNSLHDFAQFLMDDAVLSERERQEEMAFDRVIQDFLQAYPRFRETDQFLARSILQKFVSLLFRKQEEIDIYNVFIWLQALSDTPLLSDAVELVSSKKWKPEERTDPDKHKRFELLCRRSRASIWRRQRLYDEARSELNALLAEWAAFDPTEVRELSVIEYEIGYLEYLLGNTTEAASALFAGARHAEQVGDTVGMLINSFCGHNSLFQGRQATIDETRAQFEEHLAGMNQQQELKPREARVIGWLFTMSHRLFEIACDEGEAETAARLARDVQQNELVQRGKDDPAYRLVRAGDAARLAAVRGDGKTALEAWTAFLDVELPGLEPLRQPELVKFHWDRPEQAVHYREAGKVLRELGNPELACLVWNRGLECPDDAGNRYFKMDIRALLEATDLEASPTVS